MSKTCPQCGAACNDDAKFCKTCGNKLPESDPAPSNSVSAPSAASADEETHKPPARTVQPLPSESSPFSSIGDASDANDADAEQDKGEQGASKTEPETQGDAGSSPFAAIESVAESSAAEDSTQGKSTHKDSSNGDPAQPERLADFTPTFAEGLPAWDLVPPNMMVMRKG